MTKANVGPSSTGDDDSVQYLQETLFCVAGMVIFVITLPDFLVLFYVIISSHFQGHGLTQQTWLKSITLLLKMILSLVLIFKASNLSRWLKQLRYAGLK